MTTTTDFPRDWAAVMSGDRVLDGAGRTWVVNRVMPEDTPAGTVLWVELDGGGSQGSRVMRIERPERGGRVRLIEGPGWGIAASSEKAMSWARELIGRVLGGSLADTAGP